jgi:small subunit ribosomal protein S9
MQNFDAVGRRKTAVARVRLTPGTGKRIINNLPMKKYLQREVLEMVVEQPFQVAEMSDRFDMRVNVYGGGLSGQAGAIRLGIARALVEFDEALRLVMRKNGYMTRDSRMVERKKSGRPKARKRFQFSKR